MKKLRLLPSAVLAANLLLCAAFLSTEVKCQTMNEYKLEQHLIDSLNKLKVSNDFKPTNYKAGFTYYDNRGCKNTLLKWTFVGKWFGVNIYRWRIKCEWLGVTALAWTDDCWIDVYTQKAYLNERTHKIVYYDSLEVSN